MNFGEYCRREVQKQGKSITWLAQQIGAHPSLIVKWRTRNCDPKTNYFLRVCVVLADMQNKPLIGIITDAAEIMEIKIKENQHGDSTRL